MRSQRDTPNQSKTSLQEPRQAPPVGRALRIVLGLALIVYVAPVYYQITARISMRVLLLIFGLVGIYSLLQIVISRRIFAFDSCLGALVAAAFLGVSLLVAGVRATPGCEVMAIPGLLFGKDTELACLIFSPMDRLERKLRSKRGV